MNFSFFTVFLINRNIIKLKDKNLQTYAVLRIIIWPIWRGG